MSIKINGTAGIEMASDDSLTFGDVAINRDNVGGRKNAIINGNFDVWQRGTGPLAGSGFLADRWRVSQSGSTMSSSQGVFTIGQTDVPGNPKYYLDLDVSVGATSARIEQKIEGVETFAGETITLSFYARGINPGGGDMAVKMVQYFGTGGSPSTTVTTSEQGFTLTAGWTKYTITISIPSISGKTIGTDGNDYLQLYIQQRDADASTDAWNIDVAQVQLEAGSQATPFERRSYGEELALCQRYYEVGEDYSFVVVTGIVGVYPSRGFAVEKRVQPTMTLTISAGTGATVLARKNGFHQATNNSANVGTPWTADAEL